jgi:hypothetical protein
MHNTYQNVQGVCEAKRALRLSGLELIEILL